MGDRGQRVGEIALFERLFQIDRLNRPLLGRRRAFSHTVWLTHRVSRLKRHLVSGRVRFPAQEIEQAFAGIGEFEAVGRQGVPLQKEPGEPEARDNIGGGELC